jgi:hypothetical protein
MNLILLKVIYVSLFYNITGYLFIFLKSKYIFIKYENKFKKYHFHNLDNITIIPPTRSPPNIYWQRDLHPYPHVFYCLYLKKSYASRLNYWSLIFATQDEHIILAVSILLVFLSFLQIIYPHWIKS